MQLHLVMRGHDVLLPIAYRYLIQGMIYNALSVDAELATALHDGLQRTQQRAFKLFTFSPLTGYYSVADKRILFNGDIRLEIRAVQPQILLLLAESLKEGSAVALGRNALLITESRLEDCRIQREQVQIATISPIVAYQTLENGHTRFFSPTDDAFCPALVRNAERKWQHFNGEASPFSLKISPVSSDKSRKTITCFKGTYITAWDGRFILQGSENVIDFLYQTGLGAKSSQGFGMFRIES